MRRAFVVCVVLSIVVHTAGAQAVACLWDYDTLKMERSQFPTALELITGKFLRHSSEYYHWRIKDRIARLQREPKNLALYDDLAVAYDKVSLHDKAIETILKKENLKPGLYETYANLGTFYIHSGQLEKGLEQIKRAIKINPDAHFGREVYQQLLVQYVLEIRKSGRIELPLSPTNRNGVLKRSFANFVLNRRKPSDGVDKELARAVKGILGMMRFGKFDSPILLEALGDLLGEQGKRGDRRNGGAKRLGARAYLKASHEVRDSEARGNYRRLATQTLMLQSDRGAPKSLSLARLETRFDSELVQAREWYAELESDEKQWVASGADVDSEFSRKYYEEPTLALKEPWSLFRIGLVATIVCLLVISSVLFIVLRSRRRLQSVNEDGRREIVS